MSEGNARSSARCWNCDQDAHETVAVTLRMPSGSASTFHLCGRCYDADYIPQAEALGVAIGPGAVVLDFSRVPGTTPETI